MMNHKAVALMDAFLEENGYKNDMNDIRLHHDIGMLSVLLFFVGVWVPFKSAIINKFLCILGLSGIVVSELYKFLTWHILTITGEMSIQSSIRLAFPEFYIGLIVSILMIAVYFVIEKSVKE